MTILQAETMDEKYGHRINRQVVETFQPWCGICKVPVPHGFGDVPWLNDLDAARTVLRDHVAAFHATQR